MYKCAALALCGVTAALFAVGWLTAAHQVTGGNPLVSLPLSAHWCLLGIVVGVCAMFCAVLANSMELHQRLRRLESQRGEGENA